MSDNMTAREKLGELIQKAKARKPTALGALADARFQKELKAIEAEGLSKQEIAHRISASFRK